MKKVYLALFIFVLTLSATASPMDKIMKRHELVQSGVKVVCSKKSTLLPEKITVENGMIYVFLNTDKKPVIGMQQCIWRWLGTIQMGATPIQAVLKDKQGCLELPLFKKSYRYEAIVNGNHFWFYRK